MDEDVAPSSGASVLQGLVLSSAPLEEHLRELTRVLAGTREQGLSCGITVRLGDRSPYTIGSSDELASRLDHVQQQAGDGPSLYALFQAVPVALHDMTQATQWPDFQRQANVEGVSSAVAIPMRSDHSTWWNPVAVLSLYVRDRSLTDNDYRWAEEFAERISGTVILAAWLYERDQLTQNLQAALISRTMIDRALGVLMAQDRCDAEHAFDRLRSFAQNRDLRLYDTAVEIVTSVSGQEPTTGSPAL